MRGRCASRSFSAARRMQQVCEQRQSVARSRRPPASMRRDRPSSGRRESIAWRRFAPGLRRDRPMQSLSSGIGSGLRLFRSAYEVKRTMCIPRPHRRSTRGLRGPPCSPAPCANRNTGGVAPHVAGSNTAVTRCSPTATLHVLLRIGESLPLAELAIRAQVADRFLLESGRLAEQREVVVRLGQVG